MDVIECECWLQAMPGGMCPVRGASGGVLQWACYWSIVYSGFVNIFIKDLEQFGGMSREHVRACFQRQPRRRNNKLGAGEIETTERNYPNETLNLAKKKYLRRSGREEENNPNHRCLMGKRALQHWNTKGYNRRQIACDFGKAMKHPCPFTEALYTLCSSKPCSSFSTDATPKLLFSVLGTSIPKSYRQSNIHWLPE